MLLNYTIRIIDGVAKKVCEVVMSCVSLHFKGTTMPTMTQPDLHILPDGRLDTRNAALYLGCSPKTLAHLRCSGNGPAFLKPGRVFYFREDLDAWLAGHGRRRSTAAGAAAVAAQH